MTKSPENLNAMPPAEPVADAPEDIRKAIQQLSFVYKRSARALAEAGENAPGTPPPAAAPIAPIGHPPVTEAINTKTIFDVEDDQIADGVRRAEAILFAAGEPLSAAQIAEAMPAGVDVPAVLMTLKSAYANRGVRLIEVAGKWRFQTADDLAFLFVEERHEQKKLTQAALETLAIIAYGQPVTRAEIEAVRGVAVSKGTIDLLMETGWVRVKGRRKTPGRPVTLGTTDAFLEHFSLESLELLPGRAELESEGLLSDVIPDGFDVDGFEEGSEADEQGSDKADGEAEGFITDFIGDEVGEDGAES